MAKTSMINREIKRTKLVEAVRRQARRAEEDHQPARPRRYEDKMDAVVKLQKLPRDSSPAASATVAR